MKSSSPRQHQCQERQQDHLLKTTGGAFSRRASRRARLHPLQRHRLLFIAEVQRERRRRWFPGARVQIPTAFVIRRRGRPRAKRGEVQTIGALEQTGGHAQLLITRGGFTHVSQLQRPAPRWFQVQLQFRKSTSTQRREGEIPVVFLRLCFHSRGLRRSRLRLFILDQGGQVRRQPGQLPLRGGQVRRQPGQLPLRGGQVRRLPGKVGPLRDGQVRWLPGKVGSFRDGQVRRQPGKVGSFRDGQVRRQPGKVGPIGGCRDLQPGKVGPIGGCRDLQPG